MPALVGGGAHARPGEISLAHNGVLFLDELPEFHGIMAQTPQENGRPRAKFCAWKTNTF
jgi:predicted ATPase with chaperone activity